jgi:hypothetical protein
MIRDRQGVRRPAHEVYAAPNLPNQAELAWGRALQFGR